MQHTSYLLQTQVQHGSPFLWSSLPHTDRCRRLQTAHCTGADEPPPSALRDWAAAVRLTSSSGSRGRGWEGKRENNNTQGRLQLVMLVNRCTQAIIILKHAL